MIAHYNLEFSEDCFTRKENYYCSWKHPSFCKSIIDRHTAKQEYFIFRYYLIHLIIWPNLGEAITPFLLNVISILVSLMQVIKQTQTEYIGIG